MSDTSVLLALESHAFVKMRKIKIIQQNSQAALFYDEVSIRIEFKIYIRKSEKV